MLNTFPELLTYSFFAPTLVRACIAGALVYLAYHQWQRRNEIREARSVVYPTLSIVFNVAVSIALLCGYYTQVAALLAIAGFMVGLYMNRRHSSIVILPNSTVIILIVTSCTLLLTGAGAFAMDLPL